MSDILQRIRAAYMANPASALDMLPELFQAHDDGAIIEPPCKIGDEVSAKVMRPYNGHICKINGKVSDIQLVVRVMQNEIRHVDFLASDFGKTVLISEKANEAIKNDNSTEKHS